MNPFKLGAAALCVTKGIPCVPIALRGSYAAMPRGRNWPQPGKPRVAVRYGRPLLPRGGRGRPRVQRPRGQAVTRLWAEEDLGWYRSLRAQAEGRLALPTGPEAVLKGPLSGAVEPAPKPQAAKVASWRRTWESTRPLTPRRRPSAWQED